MIPSGPNCSEIRLHYFVSTFMNNLSFCFYLKLIITLQRTIWHNKNVFLIIASQLSQAKKCDVAPYLIKRYDSPVYCKHICFK